MKTCKTCGGIILGPVVETVGQETVDLAKAGYCRLGCVRPLVEQTIRDAIQRVKMN